MPQQTSPTTDDQLAPVAGPRSLYFSQGGITGGGGNITVSAAILPIVLLGGFGLSIAAFVALAKFPWLPVAARALIISVICIIGLYWIGKALARGYRRAMTALKMPMEMDPSAVVNVICWPDQKQRIERLIPPQGNEGAFEPEACRVWIARRTSMAKKYQDVRFRKRMLISIIIWPILINTVAQLAVYKVITIDYQAVIAVLIFGLMIPIGWGFLHPTFLRVSPGRIDIFKFGYFGRKPSVETISLRGVPIRLDLRRKELLIGGWTPIHPESEPDSEPEEPAVESAEPETKLNNSMMTQVQKNAQEALGSDSQVRDLVIIPLWATLGVRTLEEAVFRAAVSTAEPMPLPDDKLIG